MGEQDIKAGFRKALDSHGYGFQYAVLEEARRCYERSVSTWVFEVSEFPVRVTSGSTRIDFVLKQRDTLSYLVGECKRSNPALMNWCFAKAPYVATQSVTHPYMIDLVRHFHGEVRAEGSALTDPDEAYHIALEVKSPQKGESHAGGRGAIEEAVTQVLRGANGFVNFLASKPSLVPENTKSSILSAVFTTAKLWVTDAALHKANVEDGKIDFAGTTVKQVPWLVYQHFQSPELRHDVAGTRVDKTLSRILQFEYMRSVAIVSSGGIAEFLKWSSTFPG